MEDIKTVIEYAKDSFLQAIITSNDSENLFCEDNPKLRCCAKFLALDINGLEPLKYIGEMIQPCEVGVFESMSPCCMLNFINRLKNCNKAMIFIDDECDSLSAIDFAIKKLKTYHIYDCLDKIYYLPAYMSSDCDTSKKDPKLTIFYGVLLE